jgi:hypothetical protein
MASETTTGGSTTSSTTLVTVAIGGAIVGAALAGVLYFSSAAGDEPPIWVKNGSIDIELLHNSKEWREDGNRANWKISKGTRGKDVYQVLIAPSNAASCSGDLQPMAGTITFEYSETGSTRIELSAAGKHTHVRVVPPQDLNLSADKRTLSLGTLSGYITKIQAGQTTCTFTAKDPGLAVALLDR